MKTLICILLLLIGFISECDAQSGWILWDKVSIEPWEFATLMKNPNPDWRLIHAYSSYEECQVKVLVVAAAEENYWRGNIGKPLVDEKPWSSLLIKEVVNLGVGDYLVTLQATGPKGEIGRPLGVFHEFKCFPATFDPRK